MVGMLVASWGIHRKKKEKKIKDIHILSREAPGSGNTVVLFYLFSDQVLIKMMGYR